VFEPKQRAFSGRTETAGIEEVGMVAVRIGVLDFEGANSGENVQMPTFGSRIGFAA
jgi:hypothetical protein